jgi:8-oxo-dGTP pyrophosphatase MutT (NUDIX family)
LHRSQLLTLLKFYPLSGGRDRYMRDQTIRFVETTRRCFDRTLKTGHVTGSAWIINPSRTHALLTLHARLGRWVQLGGHADNDPDIIGVATREAREESGLTSLRLLARHIFDIDVHRIPLYGAMPAHFHYDIRFLFEADDTEPLVISAESKDLAWVNISDMLGTGVEESLARMCRKSPMAKKAKKPVITP